MGSEGSSFTRLIADRNLPPSESAERRLVEGNVEDRLGRILKGQRLEIRNKTAASTEGKRSTFVRTEKKYKRPLAG